MVRDFCSVFYAVYGGRCANIHNESMITQEGRRKGLTEKLLSCKSSQG